jgi:hypothetical protein
LHQITEIDKRTQEIVELFEKSSLIEIAESDSDSSQTVDPIQTKLNSARIIKSKGKHARQELTQSTIQDDNIATTILKCQGTIIK